MLVFHKELDQAINVWRFPLEVAFGGVSGTNIGFEEEKTRVGVGPVVWDGEFFLFGLDVGDYAFKVLVVADEFEGSRGADAFDGVEIVAAEQNAEVDELGVVSEKNCWEAGIVRTCSRSMAKPSSTLSRCISRIGSLRCSLNVRCLSRIGVLKVSVSISSLAAAYTLPPLASTAHCASASVGAIMYGIPINLSSC
jgi:hypothetical protein